MKCENCGAQIGFDEEKCPYCGTLNTAAISRKQRINDMEEQNRQLFANTLDKEKTTIIYKVWVRINIVLTCVFAAAFIVLLAVSLVDEFIYDNDIGKGDAIEQMNHYYDEGQLMELNRCMHDNDLFDSQKRYDCSQIALLWGNYMDCQKEFAESYENYLSTGCYKQWQLERCIDLGYEVLTGNISHIYGEKMSDRNKELLKPYQDDIKIMFTGILKVPLEMLNDPDVYDADDIYEYVLEALPCEK